MVNLDDIRVFDAAGARQLLGDPHEYLPHWEKVLNEVINDGGRFPRDEKEAAEAGPRRMLLGFEGAVGRAEVTPRGLGSGLLSQLVAVEGIVTRASLVKPKLVQSIQYNAVRNKSYVRSYRDATSAFGVAAPLVFMTKDPETKEPLSLEFGLSLYKDHQTCTLQEMPEKTPAGQLPRAVDIVMDEDLADAVKPGDRVRITGVYRALPSVHDGRSKGVFRSVILACGVAKAGKEKAAGGLLTPQDVTHILEIGRKDDVFERMAASIAPSIYGHDHVKKAILLQLLGGTERNLDNGTHIRGDINIMMVGDPSTAKSQLLRFVLHLAPLAVSTSGRGSSGVGLTAAVVQDSETGERRLEAGAMVLADRGICCIDEFDKMSEDDRVAIHEVMEQGSCTINKAGIHTQLNARCSVLAAANPVYGQYNRQKKPSENIALPDSLLSRFDLMFIVLDNLDPRQDRAISQHVLRMHMYKSPGHVEGADRTIIEEEQDQHNVVASSLAAGGSVGAEQEARETPVMHKFGYGARGGEMVFTVEFMKKYIAYARARRSPVLTPEASKFICERYAELRSKEDIKTLPVTPRTLETMIRLTTAHAKCRLQDMATLVDAEAACELMNFALYNEVRRAPEHIPDALAPVPRPVDEQDGAPEAQPGEKRGTAEVREGEEEIGDKRPREEEERQQQQQVEPQRQQQYVVEGARERALRGRRLLRIAMGRAREESLTSQQAAKLMNIEQEESGYAPWTPEEVFAVVEAWAEEESDRAMVDIGSQTVFLFG